jgi:hypothetical protein
MPWVPPQIVITEIMVNPGVVMDGNGEWFELYNAGSTTVNLHGWTMADAGQDSHTIAAPGGILYIVPGDYIVLGVSNDTALNGNVVVDYVYPGPPDFSLSNMADEIHLLDGQMNLVDKVEYDVASGWAIPSGVSLSLKNAALDNAVFGNWCQETSVWTGSAGDFGSPGSAAVCQ